MHKQQGISSLVKIKRRLSPVCLMLLLHVLPCFYWLVRETKTVFQAWPQHFLYFFPLPQGQGELRDTLSERNGCCFSFTKSISVEDGILNENVVWPPLYVIAKSPLLITSMPISISWPVILPFVTLILGTATLFGR